MEPRYNPADPPQAETQEGIQAGTQEGIQAGTQGALQEAETSIMGSGRWVNSPLSLRENDRTLNVS